MTINQTYTSDGPVSASTAATVEVSTHPHPVPVAANPEANAEALLDSAPYPKPGVPVDAVTDYNVIKPYFDGVVKPNLQILLAMVLGDVDAAIPNKDQNKAVKNLIRRQFDEQMLEMQRMWVQRSHYGTTDQYLLKPDPA